MKNPYQRPKKPLNSDMNVVPYIDVMLVLLVIFMVTAPMLTTGVEVDLPSAAAENIQNDAHPPILLALKADGSLYISYNDVVDEAVDPTALIAKLRDIGATDQTPVFVGADAASEYRVVAGVMASLQGAGVGKVGLLTEPPNP